MKQKKLWMRVVIAVCCLSWLTSCVENVDNPSGGSTGYSTAIFVASDRHETGNGNNLTAMLAKAAAGSSTRPQTVLLGGDYVGGKKDMKPVFSINDLYDEIYAVVDPLNTRVMMTYGSHDVSCMEGYDAFYSGPRRCDGYYTYGISFAQMTFDTDSATVAAFRYYQEHPEEQDSPMPPPMPEEGDGTMPIPPEGNMPIQKGYNGIDLADRYGISAESGAQSFIQWVSTIADHDPIVVMSHVPMHTNRGDNGGGLTWYKALATAALTHDVIVLWGHNHTMEEMGKPIDLDNYLLTAGDSIDVQGDSITGVVRCPLNFTYANAGYLKLGYASVITFTDTRRSGHYDTVELRRFSLNTDDTDNQFGLTGKQNPYVIELSRTE